jgi:ATP-dependent RNA/DNA helicase IGHMBP2
MNSPAPEEQIKELLNLHSLEQAYEREQHRVLLEATPLAQRCKQGISLYPLDLRQQDVGLGGRPVLEFATSQSLSGFYPGQPVALFSLAANEEPVAGVIQRVFDTGLKVYLNSPEAPEWIDDGKLGLDLYHDETTWRAISFALGHLERAERPRLKSLRDVLMGQTPARFLDGLKVPELPGLNPAQNQALARVMQADDLALIHGPPGTGKTTTLVACIEAVLATRQQVLVCAPSNTAVDLLTRALGTRGRRVVRLGHPARMQEDIWPWTLEEQFENHPNGPVLKNLRREMVKLRRQASRFRRNFGPAEREERRQLYSQARSIGREINELETQMTQTLLDQADVITCTLVGSWQHVLKGRSFGTVFIDEAAQALEGACWIPVLKADKLVMAGDHCQLPPTIKNPAASALGLTLFEKAIARQPGAAILLDTQYRMHETIMEFPSLSFYEGRLKAAPAVARRLLNPEQAADHMVNLPLEWLDTAGCGFDEQLDPESKSFANPEEAKILGLHLQSLLDDPEFPTGAVSIGVIAPYRRQVETLRTQLSIRLPAQARLEIETVDSFQGQERDIVYISLVRSNNDGQIGFLQDLRRTNVAMTRARKKLVMVGDSATLSNHRFYRELLEYVEAYGHWRSAWELAGSW